MPVRTVIEQQEELSNGVLSTIKQLILAAKSFSILKRLADRRSAQRLSFALVSAGNRPLARQVSPAWHDLEVNNEFRKWQRQFTRCLLCRLI
jgi:hypothetical protein